MGYLPRYYSGESQMPFFREKSAFMVRSQLWFVYRLKSTTNSECFKKIILMLKTAASIFKEQTFPRGGACEQHEIRIRTNCCQEQQGEKRAQGRGVRSRLERRRDLYPVGGDWFNRKTSEEYKSPEAFS
jgi:hypothetical protein